jgi:pimeloyl-ACP methyl ester carboxylesterase
MSVTGTMAKFLGIVLIVLIALYGLACLALYLGQRSMIYYPPQQAALAAPVVSSLAVPGAVLKVSERPLEGRKALIYFGGNAEDVSTSLPLLAQAFPHRALYLPHYRGYAGSTGSPTEKDLVADALLLVDRVAAVHPDIVLVGRSLGSGVAVQVASQRKVERLVLVTPYESIAGIAADQFRAFPVRWLLKDNYESGRYAPQVRAPTLIVAAARDEVIPAWSTRQLLSRFAPGIATWRELDGVGHNTIAQSPDYISALQWAQ